MDNAVSVIKPYYKATQRLLAIGNDCAGATPIIYGNFKQLYMIANRKAVTMQHESYSAGFCSLFKVESRIGGSVVCPNAARLLRIK
jgi:HK97 family phage major capsid protein